MSVSDVIVVGAGPAGSTVACLLALRGISTLLIEEKRLPREKLCGAFIAPECFSTLQRLGAMDRVLGAGAQTISEFRLLAPSGRGATASISAISRGGDRALSLSRTSFDGILFDQARKAGAVCLEGMAVKRALSNGNRACGVECVSLPAGETRVFEAPLVIDASGRNSRLSLAPAERIAGNKGKRLYALKADLQHVDLPPERVELYFFQTGYGGLSLVERGLANLCFITTEKSLRDAAGDADRVMRETIMTNPAARQRLASARMVGKWLSAGPLIFGPRRLFRDGIIAVGDAAGMIDPFTGTGIQIALRSGEILADCIVQALVERGGLNMAGFSEKPSTPGVGSTATVIEAAEQARYDYERHYQAEFGSRMAVAGVFRLAAFSPRAAALLSIVFAGSPRLANMTLRATRLGRRPESMPIT